MDTSGSADAATRRALDGELRLVREAILMVASGGAPSVVVAGLQLGATILDAARRFALESGVRVVPLWSGDETLLDIRIEAIGP